MSASIIWNFSAGRALSIPARIRWHPPETAPIARAAGLERFRQHGLGDVVIGVSPGAGLWNRQNAGSQRSPKPRIS
jgi:hypothetical protein